MITNFYSDKINDNKTKDTAEIYELTPPSISKDKIISSSKPETSLLELSDNININNEKEIINEKRKINIFNYIEEEKSEDEEDSNQNQNKIIEKEENKTENEKNKFLEISSLIKKKKTKKINILRFSNYKTNFVNILRFSNYKTNFVSQRGSLFSNNFTNAFGNKNKKTNNNLRKTIIENNDFNKMRRISITNFTKLNNNKKNINHIKNNIKNFIKYENMFLEDEFFLRAPGSYPDEDEENYLLKLNFLEENNYFDEENISNNEYVDKPLLRQTNSISYNSKLIEKKIGSKFLLNSMPFDKIEEEDDKEGKKNIKKKIDRLTIVDNSKKNLYIDENEIPGKNIQYAEIGKINNFVKGTFKKNLVNFENESPISFMSINLFIKKIASYNFRINYPILYKAFLQQYKIFLSIPLFVEKIMQAFELYYNKNNKITSELINLLNKVISENYEKIKEDFILLGKIKNFYYYMKEYIFTESETGLEKDIDNIYYILFEPDSEEDINYSRRFVMERRKSNSIFIKSKTIYSNIFNKIKDDKNTKKKKLLFSSKTNIKPFYNYFYIFSHNSMEIAQYLTCISYQLMRNINQKELLNKNFYSKEKLIKAPNVMKFIDRFNKLVLFVIEDIFSYDNKKVRCQCIEKWVDIALKLQELHNYNDLIMINTCFINLTLKKLKLTFKKLSNKYKNIIKEMNAFCSSEDSYLNIRKLIFNSKGIPYIPHLGIILKVITNIEEMNYITDDNNINFEKLVKLHNVLKTFNEFKKTKFYCEKSKELDILANLKPKTLEELDEMVGQIEPKLKVFAIRGNKKRLTNTDKFYYEKKISK